jgi:hypothetical protein
MRGPIDFIVVGFEGNKFDGSILQSLTQALDKDVIGLLALSVISKDEHGIVTEAKLTEEDDEYFFAVRNYLPDDSMPVEQDDIDEIADLLENDTSAALLVVEQLWAKPLKKAIMDAHGILVADGRIHPEAAKQLSEHKA